jgi:glucose-1-phosphate adenylyltransferase
LGRATGDWYRGTADAVYQNLDFVLDKQADTVLILSGDHIYKMDYRPMLAFHQATDADLTVAVRNVPLEETDRFGIMTVDDEMKVVEFTEKPPNRDKGTLASMGIYVFKADMLTEQLEAMHQEVPDLDFGKHVIPHMIGQSHTPFGALRGDALPAALTRAGRANLARVYAYRFEGYWVDVGTVHAYWETNLEMAQPVPPLDLYNPDWIIHTRDQERPAAKIGLQGQVVNSLISNGCVIRGTVEHSVLSPGVYVSPGAVVRESVVLTDTWIGPGGLIDTAILDVEVVVGPGAIVGHGDDYTPNHDQPDRLNTGITVVGERVRIPGGMRLGRNILIRPGRTESDFPEAAVPSGETV